jgi:hypothetical protein
MFLKYATIEKHLRIHTIIYLAIPIIIFFLGWLRLPIATALTIILLLAIYLYIKYFQQVETVKKFDDDASVSVSKLCIALLPGIFMVVICGAGGWGFQDADWWKHNAILKDLVNDNWPVIYNNAEGSAMMVYYIAYYLPAALFGKWFGWQAANHALFFITLIGVVLSILWVIALTRSHPFVGGIMFFLFSGMDIIGQIITSASPWYHIEWWARIGQYSSNAALLFWVPQQALPGWLITSLFLCSILHQNFHRHWFFLFSLSFLWSPFITIGLFPLFAGILIIHYTRSRYYLNDMVSFPNFAGSIIGLVFFLYFFSRLDYYPLPAYVKQLGQGGFMWNFNQNNFWFFYILFVLLEFFVLSVFVYYLRKAEKNRDEIKLLVLSVFILIALPFFKYGLHNDLVMRASIPSLFVVLIITVKTIGTLKYKKYAYAAIVGIIAIGGVTPAIETSRHLLIGYRKQIVISIPEKKSIQTIFQLQDEKYRYFNFVGQYLGSVDSFFGKYMKRSTPIHAEKSSDQKGRVFEG